MMTMQELIAKQGNLDGLEIIEQSNGTCLVRPAATTASPQQTAKRTLFEKVDDEEFFSP